MKTLSKYSLGVGDRFSHEGKHTQAIIKQQADGDRSV
jgi:hypothetical protein